ncbi:hypothetical protein ACF0H5_023351 [Mactra antiquata]
MPQQDAITGPGPPTSSGSETNHQSPTRDDYTTPYDLVVDFKPKLLKIRSKIPVFTGVMSDQAIGRDDVSKYVGTQVPVCTRMSNGEVVRGDNGRKSLIPRPLTALRLGGNVKVVSPSHIKPPSDEGCTPLSTMASNKRPSRLPVPTGNGFKSPPSGERTMVSRHKGRSLIPRYISSNVKTSGRSFNLHDDETMKTQVVLLDEKCDDSNKKHMTETDVKPDLDNSKDDTTNATEYGGDVNSTLAVANGECKGNGASHEAAIDEVATHVDEEIVKENDINGRPQYIFQEKILSKELEIRSRIRIFDEILEAMLTERSELEEVAGELNDLNRAVDEFGEQKDDEDKFITLCRQSQNVESKLPFLPKDTIADLFDIQVPGTTTEDDSVKKLIQQLKEAEMDTADLEAKDAHITSIIEQFVLGPENSPDDGFKYYVEKEDEMLKTDKNQTCTIDAIMDKYKLHEFEMNPNSCRVQYPENEVSVFKLEKYDRFRDATKYKPYLDTIHEVPEEYDKDDVDGTSSDGNDWGENSLKDKGREDSVDMANASDTFVGDGVIVNNIVAVNGMVSVASTDGSNEDKSNECLPEKQNVEKNAKCEAKVESVESLESVRLDISSELHEFRKTLLTEYSTQADIWGKRNDSDTAETMNVLKVWDKDADVENNECDIGDVEDGDVDDLLVAIKCMRSYAYRGNTDVLSTIDQMVDRFIVGSGDGVNEVDDNSHVDNGMTTDVDEKTMKTEDDDDGNVDSNDIGTDIDKDIVKTEDVDIEQIERDCIAAMNAILEIVVAQEAQNGSEVENAGREDDDVITSGYDSDESLKCLRLVFGVDNIAEMIGDRVVKQSTVVNETALTEDEEHLNGNVETGRSWNACPNNDGEGYDDDKHTEVMGHNVDSRVSQNMFSAADLKLDLREEMVGGEDHKIMGKKVELLTHEAYGDAPKRSKSENDLYNIKADVLLSRSLNSLDLVKRRDQMIQSHRLSLSTVRCITDRMRKVQNAVSRRSPSTKSEASISGLSESDIESYDDEKKTPAEVDGVVDVSDGHGENDQLGEQKLEIQGSMNVLEKAKTPEWRNDVIIRFDKDGKGLLLEQYLTDVSGYADECNKKMVDMVEAEQDRLSSAVKVMGEVSNSKLNAMCDTVCLDIKGQAVDATGRNCDHLKQAHDEFIRDVDVLKQEIARVKEIKDKIQIGTEQMKCKPEEKCDKKMPDPDISTLGPEAKCIFPTNNKRASRKWTSGVETSNRGTEDNLERKRNTYQAIHQSKRKFGDKIKTDNKEAIDLDGLRIDGTNLADVKSSRVNNGTMKNGENVKRMANRDLPDIKAAKRPPVAVEKTKRDAVDKVQNNKRGTVRKGLNIGSYSQQRSQKSLNPHRPLPSIKPGLNGNNSRMQQGQNNAGSDVPKTSDAKDNVMVQNSDFLLNPLPPINPKRGKK